MTPPSLGGTVKLRTREGGALMYANVWSLAPHWRGLDPLLSLAIIAAVLHGELHLAVACIMAQVTAEAGA